MKRQPEEIVVMVQRRVNERKQYRWSIPFVGGSVVLLCFLFLKLFFAHQEAVDGGLLQDVNFWRGVVFTILFLTTIGYGLVGLVTMVSYAHGFERDMDNLLLELWKAQRGQQPKGEPGNARS